MVKCYHKGFRCVDKLLSKSAPKDGCLEHVLPIKVRINLAKFNIARRGALM